MTKQEAVAYLRKRVMLDKLFERELPDPRKGTVEAVEELDAMTKSPEDRKKNLTTDPSSV